MIRNIIIIVLCGTLIACVFHINTLHSKQSKITPENAVDATLTIAKDNYILPKSKWEISMFDVRDNSATEISLKSPPASKYEKSCWIKK